MVREQSAALEALTPRRLVQRPRRQDATSVTIRSKYSQLTHQASTEVHGPTHNPRIVAPPLSLTLWFTFAE